MRRLSIFISFISIVSCISAQAGKDTVYFVDTMYRDRTVEKVIYVYGNPEHYWSISAGISGAYNFMQSIPTTKQHAWSWSASATANYLKYNWMIDFGLQYTQLTRNIDKIHQSAHYEYTTYTHTDTLSWYDIEIDGVVKRIYITESTQRDTVYTSYVDSLAKYTNKYTMLYIPLWLGYQVRYGFLCIDAKAGLIPGFCIDSRESNIIIDNNENLQAEKGKLSPFVCDIGARLQFRYLLTFNIILGFQVDYYYSLISLNTTKGYFDSRYHAFGINLSCAFLLKEKD